jgi:hypothetical protein
MAARSVNFISKMGVKDQLKSPAALRLGKYPVSLRYEAELAPEKVSGHWQWRNVFPLSGIEAQFLCRVRLIHMALDTQVL